MNISWQWLAELIDLIDITPEYLADRLTLASFEVENITENNDKDTILEISTTANRADTLSMIGIAKEIAAILERPYKYQYNHATLKVKHTKINNNEKQCSNHIYTTIKDITIKESPKWLKDRLCAQDIKSENNLSDILAFIALKWGIAIQSFDLDLIHLNKSNAIQLKTERQQSNEAFIDRYNNAIINYPKYPITTTTINNSNIYLAGITTSKNSEITHNTQNIVIQATVCDKFYIKRLSQQFKFNTNESILQEKGINPCDLLYGYSEAILLINKLCGGISDMTKYASKPKNIYKPIFLDNQDIIDILGAKKLKPCSSQSHDLNLNTILDILNNLNLITYKFIEYLQIDIPLSRIDDIYRDIDIIEEITRIYGFDKFIDNIPPKTIYGEKTIPLYKLAHIRSILRSMGMHETMHSSLIANNNSTLKIYNPLTEEYNNLKDNLLCGLIESYIYNNKKGNEGLEIFETGRVFNTTSAFQQQYTEVIHLAGLLGNTSSNRYNWSDTPKPLSWFQAKGDIEEFFERMNINLTWKKIDCNWSLYKTINHYFHPKNIAMLFYKDQAIGIFGEINFGLLQQLDIQVYGFEIMISKLPISNNRINHFTEYSKYPSITRDIKIKINTKKPYSEILHKIKRVDEPLIESIDLFDVYQNSTYEKNFGLRIKYRSPVTTLTGSEVEIIEQRIKDHF